LSSDRPTTQDPNNAAHLDAPPLDQVALNKRFDGIPRMLALLTEFRHGRKSAALRMAAVYQAYQRWSFVRTAKSDYAYGRQ
jgi:hypothetical protein